MNLFKHLMATAGLLLALAVSAVAQTTVNSTTLAAAVATGANQVALASVTNVAVGNYLVVVTGDRAREVMTVRAIAGTNVTVSRATSPISAPNGTRVHASGSTVYTGVAGRFSQTESTGVCVAAATTFTPRIVLPSGNISTCSPAGVWYRHDQRVTVTCRMLLIADMVDQSCTTIDRPMLLVGATYASKVAESGGTLTVRIMREQGTEAAASGDLLATALSGVSTVAETVTPYVLSTTSSFLLLSSGERLGVDFTDDVAGELAGLTITFTLAPR